MPGEQLMDYIYALGGHVAFMRAGHVQNSFPAQGPGSQTIQAIQGNKDVVAMLTTSTWLGGTEIHVLFQL